MHTGKDHPQVEQEHRKARAPRKQINPSDPKVKSLSHVLLLATPWTAAYQAPPSMGFSRQEYWSGVPLPSPSQNLARPNTMAPALALRNGSHLKPEHKNSCLHLSPSSLPSGESHGPLHPQLTKREGLVGSENTA